jgi:NADPH2:quinone reductase
VKDGIMKAVRVHSYGGPEVLKYEDVPVPTAGKGEAVVKIGAAGLNFIDIYFRSGVSRAAQLPFTPGHEGAGYCERNRRRRHGSEGR